MNGQLYWHIHHNMLCEPLTEPIGERIEYIKNNKPAHEIATRLRLLKPVRNPERLPAKWKEAYANWTEAYAKWEEADAKQREADANWTEVGAKWKEAYANWTEAGAKRTEAGAKHLPEIEALHKDECPNCPWNGITIFP